MAISQRGASRAACGPLARRAKSQRMLQPRMVRKQVGEADNAAAAGSETALAEKDAEIQSLRMVIEKNKMEIEKNNTEVKTMAGIGLLAGVCVVVLVVVGATR
ncbi:hypothetical protein HYH03_010810 [Edaphochlamys debaryana]|uniref:Uncharacterized protein n=1 Tax=Edaphochlamys debaryana TaxID=47281 RepID=A0A835Y4J0_9CHLO|nr:hypothetical protein HYH03_010810 [Edaphochlamys debaryana]|eukprot:KAG2490894.1 hypothetical protein HYH03_010810 [Edaphochlamys debaryana]